MVLVVHIYFRECCSQLILMGNMGVWEGAVIVNTGSSYLIDDCALKQALNDGSVAGCALDGVEGPQWLEAWVCILEAPDITLLQ